jgi:hypothetical protein
LVHVVVQLELRLDLYTQGSQPVVLKQYLPLEAFNYTKDGVVMGPLTLTNTTCFGNNLSLWCGMFLSFHDNLPSQIRCEALIC